MRPTNNEGWETRRKKEILEDLGFTYAGGEGDISMMNHEFIDRYLDFSTSSVEGMVKVIFEGGIEAGKENKALEVSRKFREFKDSF